MTRTVFILHLGERDLEGFFALQVPLVIRDRSQSMSFRFPLKGGVRALPF